MSTRPAAARRLLTGPAGSGKTHAALERIRAAATVPGPRGRGAAAPGEALLVLPTYAQVMHVKRRALSRWDARGILDQPFTTFTAAGERFLPSFRVRTLPSGEERDRLMEEALRQRDVPRFREVRDRPGFRAHLLRLVKELKQTGLEGGEAREHLAAGRERVGAFSREKLDGFLEVFECYEDLLERAALEDHEDALRRLARRLEERPLERPPALLVVDGFDDFSRVEERILHALTEAVTGAGGEVLVTLPWDEARPALFAGSRGSRERLLAAGFVESRLEGFARSTAVPLARLAERLFAPAGAPLDGEGLAGDGCVQALVAGDAEDEAETVARSIVRLVRGGEVAGVRGWRDVGVIVRRLGEHAPRLESAFARLGVPLRVAGGGEALASEPLVRALRGPLQVLAGDTAAGDFHAPELIEWLRWRALLAGDVALAAVDAWDLALRTRGFPGDLARLRSGAPADLRAPLDALTEAATALAAAEDASARYDVLAGALKRLAPLPEPSGFDEEGRPRDVAHDRRLARAVAARARATDILHALGRAAERTGLGGAADAAEAVRELTEALEQTNLRLADRRLDAVTLMDPEEARFWELPLVVVAGLEEGAFPQRPREDVLLRDADREALRAHDHALRLPLAREREVRERRLFYGAVTRAGSRLLLARRAYDDKGDPKERSFFLRELERVVTPEILAEARTPGRVAREAPECHTRADWRLYAAARLGPWAARRRAVGDDERALAAALREISGTSAPARAARMRRRGDDPLWGDEATRAAVLARFAEATQQVSVSRLNHAVLCPHRFFLSYVAKVPRDDLTIDGPVFDFRQMGSALHHAFELALRDPQRSPEDLAAEGVRHVAAGGFEARLLEFELRRAVALLRDRERRTGAAFTPWIDGLELRFRDANAVELGPEDCRYRLGGAVDRIDRAPGPDGGEVASILDYKRSASSVEGAWRGARDGRDLQVPLYARAVEALTGMQVVGFEWVAGIQRVRRVIHDEDAAALYADRREAKALTGLEHDAFRARIAEAEDTATEAVRTARRGEHARRPLEAGVCGDCPWRHVCRPDAAALAAPAGEEDA